MGLFLKSKTSKLMKYELAIGGETIKFNLHKELLVTNRDISIKEAPAIYGFLKKLQAECFYEVDQAVANEEKVYSKMFVKFKGKKDSTSGRGYSDDFSEHKARASFSVIRAKLKTIKAKKKLNDINAAVRGFETKSTLLQTLSANQRKEQL